MSRRSTTDLHLVINFKKNLALFDIYTDMTGTVFLSFLIIQQCYQTNPYINLQLARSSLNTGLVKNDDDDGKSSNKLKIAN